MSETDSDLDFESADEDAEFATNIKSEEESEKFAKKLIQSSETAEVKEVAISEINKSSTDEPKEDSAEKCLITPTKVKKIAKVIPGECDSTKSVITSTEVNKTSTDVPDEANSDKSIITTNEVLNAYVPSKVKESGDISMNETQNILTEQITSTVMHPSQSETKVMKIDHVKEKSCQPESKTNPYLEPDFKPEKSRVVLRLEKKKQQKSLLAKEAAVETKEKASDLVNILREEPPEPVSYQV